MVLSDGTIRDLYLGMDLKVEPEPNWEAQLQPASLDLTLGADFIIHRKMDPHRLPCDGHFYDGATILTLNEAVELEIRQGEFVLAHTLEKITLPNYITGRLEGKSRWARMGLIVHAAGNIDPGFSGQLTLEMTNLSPFPVTVRAGDMICHISFLCLDRPCDRSYGTPGLGSHYHGQTSATPSHLFKKV
jgi:dCTP deaminase